MEEKMDEKIINFSNDQAFQLLCAALQSGAITLPFGKELQCKLLTTLKEAPMHLSRQEIVENVVHREIEPCAHADAAYLLAFYRTLIAGLAE